MRWCGGVNHSRSGAFKSQVGKNIYFLPTFNSILVLLSDAAWLLQFWKRDFKCAWERSPFRWQLRHISMFFFHLCDNLPKGGWVKEALQIPSICNCPVSTESRATINGRVFPCWVHFEIKILSLQRGCTQPLSPEQFVWKGCRWQIEQEEEPWGWARRMGIWWTRNGNQCPKPGLENSCPPFP